jgi:hypothetical protein
MSLIRDFVAGLARAGKTFNEIQETTEAAYSKKSLKKTRIYEIMETVKEGKTSVDQRQNKGARKVRSPEFVTKIALGSKVTGAQRLGSLPLEFVTKIDPGIKGNRQMMARKLAAPDMG